MLLGTNSNLFFNNPTPLPLQFNCFYSSKTELHFVFSPYETDKKQWYYSINAMFSRCKSSTFTFFFLCFFSSKSNDFTPHFLSKCHKTSIFSSIRLMAIENKESNLQERASTQKLSIFTHTKLKYINFQILIYR